MKTKRKLTKIIVFLLILFYLIRIFNYWLYDDNTYARVMMHELYETENIDMVFAGASSAYRHYNPEIWDNNLKMYTFNTGTSNQRTNATYYLLKDMFSAQHPRYVIYSMSSLLFAETEGRSNPIRDYIVFDYMEPSVDKMLYGMNTFRETSMIEGWIPFTRNANKNFFEIFENVYRIKTREEYLNYSGEVYENDIDDVYPRGYVYSNQYFTDGEIGEMSYTDFSDYEINDSDVQYMKKIADLCRENGAELIFCIPPMPYASMRLCSDYQESIDFCEKIAEELESPIFNFALAKTEYLTLPDHYFYDWAHMSGEGADYFSEKASELIGRYINGEEIDFDQYFYSSYEELLKETSWVYSTWMEPIKGGYNACSTYGLSVEPEYQFLSSEDGGESWDIIIDYSMSGFLSDQMIPEGCDMLMIRARTFGSDEAYQQQYKFKL